MCNIEIQYGEYSSLNKYGFDFKYSGKAIKFSKHIRGLKSVRCQGSYIDYISEWEKGTNYKIANIDDFGLLSTYIQFFSEYCEFTNEFIKKYNVKEYHISLIREMGFDYNGENVFLNNKRPYGNSNIYGDIADEYLRYNNIEFDDDTDDQQEWVDDNSDFLLSIHMKTLEIFDKALDELDMPLEYVKSNIKGFHRNWKISNIWLRKQKINKLLAN